MPDIDAQACKRAVVADARGLNILVQAVGQQIEPSTAMQIADAGKHAHPPGAVQIILAAVQHLAPARHAGIRQAEKPQPGLDQDRQAGVQRHLHDHRWQGIGQDLAQHDMCQVDRPAARAAATNSRSDRVMNWP